MREFTSAIEEIEYEAEREQRIAALIAEGKTRAEAVEETEPYVEFKVDDRVLRAYNPTEGQLTFMMASMGRGQSQSSRFANMINVMLESLRGDDKDYLEERLLTRGPNRLPVKTIEQIFEGLVEDWFARPTQPASGSAGSQPSGGQNSTPTTTPSLAASPENDQPGS